MDNKVEIRISTRQAMQAAKSMEFVRRNLDRIAAYLPRDRHVRDIYRQLVYDNSVIFSSLHHNLELASLNATLPRLI